MKAVACLAAALLALPASASSATGKVTPVQKVIELMEGMLTKGKEDKKNEMVQFAKYKGFCESTSAAKTQDITEATEKIELLKADIEKHTADAAALGKKIAAHDDDIATWKGDKKAATKVREIEKANYEATHKDYSESIDALERAIAVLKKQSHDRDQASFVQVASLGEMNLIPKEAKRAISAFLGQDPNVGLGVSAPEANGYEFQSNGVVDMLDKLLDKFQGERTVLEKTEIETQMAYEALMNDMKNQIEEATSNREEKAKLKAKKLQAKADANGDLEDTTTTKEADEKYLEDLVSTCEQKATDFQARQELRVEEFKAVTKAIEIISGNAVSGAADKHLPKLLQLSAKTSFAALRADLAGQSQVRASEYLRDRARELNSRVLSAVAGRVAADPFRKVKKMIKDLLIRLVEESNDEAEHKAWCDTELKVNGHTRKVKTQGVETLHAEIDELEAFLEQIAEEIEELSKAVAELDKAMAEATELRNKEKEKNEKTIEDAKGAQEAVAQALSVLNEFYAKAAEATALVQQDPEAPEIFDKPYKGMGAESGGVVGMLEVIQSDFARLEADTSSAETAAQKEYDTFMTDSKIDKTDKTKELEHKEEKQQMKTKLLQRKKDDLDGTQKELDAALDYFEKLKPTCIGTPVSYEDRVARRKQEIESLQEALRILNGEDLA